MNPHWILRWVRNEASIDEITMLCNCEERIERTDAIVASVGIPGSFTWNCPIHERVKHSSVPPCVDGEGSRPTAPRSDSKVPESLEAWRPDWYKHIID